MDQIELVRSKTDIVELISSYIPVKKAGRNFKALCPFHSEKTPSFVISPERQIFKCFGCSEGGSVFNFLMQYENMEFSEALRFLADRAGIKLESFRPSKTYQEKEKLLGINHLASEFYHYILLNHSLGKKGLTYLLGRGISMSSIKLFKLGYAPASWDNLQAFLVRKKGYPAYDLEKAGLIIKSDRGYYDRFRGRIIFPLQDHRGNVLGFSGRILMPDLEGAKYINSPETSLYHKSDLFYGLNLTKKAIKEKNQAVIVEGELDLISSYQAGVKNLVAVKGSALTESQVNLIKRFTANISLALDEDLAGDSAIHRGIEIADQAGLNIRVIKVPYGKDPDEAARHSAQLWHEAVKKTIPIYDFYLNSSVKRYGKKDAESKKKLSEELIPIIAKITNEVVKAHYIKKLAQILEVSEEVIGREIDRNNKLIRLNTGVAKHIVPARKTKIVSRREMLEELLLAFILQNDKYRQQWIQEIELEQFTGNVIKKIIEALKASSQTAFKINDFVKNLPEELLETFDRLYLQDLKITSLTGSELEHEFFQTKNELAKLNLKEQLKDRVRKLEVLEKDGQEEQLIDLRNEIQIISQKIRKLV